MKDNKNNSSILALQNSETAAPQHTPAPQKEVVEVDSVMVVVGFAGLTSLLNSVSDSNREKSVLKNRNS